MNERQRNVLLGAAAVIAVMVLFPPYTVVNFKQVVIKAGYGFLLDLPSYVTDTVVMPASVNVATLLAQIVGTLVVTGLIYFALKTK